MDDTMKDEEEISRMLASLRAVEAPDNFEGGVRSRIAERRDEASLSRPGFLLVAKFAFPMLLLLAIGGFLIVSSERELSGDMVPSVADETHDVAVLDDSRSEPTGTSTVPDINSPAAQSPVNRRAENSRPRSQGGSEDVALTSDDTTVFPDGLDPRNARVPNTEPPLGRGVAPIQLLSMMGILSACTPQSCQVREVQNGSLAQKSGIHVGDVVKKIGKRPIDSFHSTSFEAKTLEIVRDGKLITISLGRL